MRFRVDGVLQEVARPPLDIRDKIATRIKVLSRLDISEKRVPQDGRMKLLLSPPKDKDAKEVIEKAIDFRVSTLPTLFGEKIVMRILESSSDKLDIDQLGYEPAQKALLLEVIKRPYGMVLVTGPTGSGKTVSLYTFLNMLNQGDINISTAEDPAEIQLPGINQVNVNDKAGLTFAAALKSFLRQDPDIIMVGEIRDLETADISIKARPDGPPGALHAAHQRRPDHAHAPDEHGRGAVQHRVVGADDHGAAAGAPALHLQARRRYSRRPLLDAGFTEADTDGSWQPYHPVGLRALQRQRLQGPLRYLPGHADHGSDAADHSVARHGAANRRAGAPGRRAIFGGIWPAQGQTGRHVTRRSAGDHQYVKQSVNRH